MELACDAVVPGLGCDYVTSEHSAEAAHAAMMAHGGDAHANLMEGKSPVEMLQMKDEMDAHIKKLLADVS